MQKIWRKFLALIGRCKHWNGHDLTGHCRYCLEFISSYKELLEEKKARMASVSPSTKKKHFEPWKHLPRRFSQYVKSGQIVRARWMLKYRESRREKGHDLLKTYLEQLGRQQMQMQQRDFESLLARQQSGFGRYPYDGSGISSVLGGGIGGLLPGQKR